MNRQAVESSNLVSVGYDPYLAILEIEFRGGRVYQYGGVPEQLYHEPMRAPSKGRFFNARIKGWYPEERQRIF